MGKHNIDVEEKEGIAADFYKEGEHLKVMLRQEFEKKIRCALAKDGDVPLDNLIKELIEAHEEDLFQIS